MKKIDYGARNNPTFPLNIEIEQADYLNSFVHFKFRKVLSILMFDRSTEQSLLSLSSLKGGCR